MDYSNVCAFRLEKTKLSNIKFDAEKTYEKFKEVKRKTDSLYTYLGTENGTMIMYPAKPSHITGDMEHIEKCREFDPRYRSFSTVIILFKFKIFLWFFKATLEGWWLVTIFMSNNLTLDHGMLVAWM